MVPPALLNLNELRKAIGLALLYTWYVPFPFDRSAERVLGAGASDEARSRDPISGRAATDRQNLVLDIVKSVDYCVREFRRTEERSCKFLVRGGFYSLTSPKKLTVQP